MKKGQWIYYYYGAGYVYGVRFVKWVVTRMHTGGDDTHKLGVGAMVESDWLFNKGIHPKIDRGCKRGQHIIAPYHNLYRTYEGAWKNKGKIKRPTVEQVREMENGQ